MEGLARPPEMGTTDAVKDEVYAFTCETMNSLDEVELLVINWDTA
jgi:hypothetical protein